MPYSLSPEFEQAVEAKLASGEYASAEELFSDALAALDEMKARHAELKASIQARLSSAERGLARPLDIEEHLSEARRRFDSN
jgi:putative addiction module CopG family antidote